MIQSFRDTAKGIVVWVVLGVLALAFGLSFGLPSDALSLGADPIARVHGTPVRDEDYQYEYAVITQIIMPRTEIDPSFQRMLGIKEEVLEAIIERLVLVEAAEEAGLGMTAKEAEDLSLAGHVIVLGETFDLLRGDRFSYDWFKKRLLPAFQTTEPKYLEYQRQEALARTLRDLMTAATPISEGEMRAAYDKRANQLSLRYVRFEGARYADVVDVSEEQIDRHVAEHREDLVKQFGGQGVRFTKLPKQARLRVVQVLKPKAPTDGDAAAKAAHEAAVKAARALIEGAATRVRGGEDLRAVAREISQEPSSARRGGDYGWVSIEGTGSGLEAVVDEAARGLQQGILSPVIEGEEAFYLVRVDGAREGDVAEADALRELAEEALMRERGRDLARQAASEALEAIKGGKRMTDLFASGEALGFDRPGIEALGESAGPAQDRPQIRITGLFAREKPVPGLGPQPELVQVAWDADPKAEVIDRLFEVGDDVLLAAIDRKESGSEEAYKAARAELFRELRETKAAKTGAYFAHRRCLEGKAKAEIKGTDPKIKRLMTYETPPTEEEAKFRPYVMCDRVGNRGGMLRLGAFANPGRG
ncbi:MAG TPA: SurA N-terminal domain-containing protein [Nannocystaceae bacterium]|nr:SurA N-terminal domain-containing protein [Nannocystaceae bacterium]